MARSSTTFQKGHKMLPGSEKGWIKKGQRLSPETEFKKGGSIGIDVHNWAGEKALKNTKHMWVSRWKGKPKRCEKCGTTRAKKFEWANIDHKYRRVLNDYIRMCTKCHRIYDIEHNNYKNFGK